MPNFEEQEEYQNIIKQVDENYKTMKAMRPLPASRINYFLNEFSISTTHNSNSIEGNTFTYDETKLLIEKGILSSARTMRESEDIVGYKQGFDFLYTALKNGQEINEDFIKKIHWYVVRGEDYAGEYRDIQNYVGSLTRILYTPPAPSEVSKKMSLYVEKLQQDLNKNKNIVGQQDVDWVKLFSSFSEHHIEFENIHPFIDGNGRTGRLLMTYEMISVGLIPVDIRYEEREHYYAAISSYRDKEKYSTRPESKTEKMCKLLLNSELKSMQVWNNMFASYDKCTKKTEEIDKQEQHQKEDKTLLRGTAEKKVRS